MCQIELDELCRSTQLVELYLAHNILQLAHVVRRIILQKTRIRCELLLHERNRVTADVDIDSHPGLNPILGYAKVPLLPLVKACAPLNHIIHDSPAYVQLALYETPKIPPNGLTVDESASIRLYTIEWNKPHRSLYSMLNYALKTDDREDLRPYFRFVKLFLTALAKLPCVPHSRPYGEE